ncbi:MAG TPA: tetratricopeptide repeat protein [Gammaproteobacteria bacterium]|nr:tetratricopeptide repeat protein [Gammaproteobacteria bacterium]
MSLINQMLRDLDQRQTNAANETGTVHAVQPKRVPVGLVVLLTVVTCTVLAAGGWWVFGDAPTAQGARDLGLGAGEQEFAANVAAPTKEPALQPASSFRRKPESTSSPVDSRLRGNDNENVITSDSPVGATVSVANGSARISDQSRNPTADTKILDSGFRQNDEGEVETGDKPVGVALLNKEAAANSPIPSPQSPAPRAESAPIKQPAVRTPDILYREGRAALAQGNGTLAVERFTQALDKAPARHEIRLALMDALLQTGQSVTAVSVLNAGLQIAPAHLPFIMLHAKVLLRQGKPQTALAALDAAPATVTNNLRNNTEFHTLRAALLQRTEQYAAAAQLYKQLLEHNPQNSVWWSGLAISLDQSGHYPEALVAYQRALAGGSLAPSLANYARQRIQALE